MSQDQSWFVNGTSSGMITCWDLRFQLPIGTVVEIAYLTNSGKISEFTRIVRFNDQNGSKYHYYFFSVKCTHPAESRIRHLTIPGSGEVLAAVQGNNEVGLWNLESQFR